jgi:hypothetical protein
MTEYPVFQRSSSLTVDLAFADACRNVAMNLLNEIRLFVRQYAERFGKTPDVAVVLASTDLAATLATGSVRAREFEMWRYERDTGRLHVAGSSVTVFVCEHPALPAWHCEITAPGALTLGDALVHRATITAVLP